MRSSLPNHFPIGNHHHHHPAIVFMSPFRFGDERGAVVMAASTSPSPAENNREDRLGALPDPLLLDILSRLPTLDAVRTSVLSVRWRYLWMSVGALDFDECDNFFTNGKRKRVTKVKGKRKGRFVEFVDKVLAFHHTPALQKFRLFCSSEDLPVQDWVRTAVSRGVQKLDLMVIDAVEPSLPSLLFVSHSLVDLNLDLDGCELILPTSLGIVGLRRMRLHSVSFCDDRLTGELFSGSTALTSLDLVNCEYHNLGRLEISGPSLQRLTINKDRFHNDGLRNCEVKVAAPRLTSFTYRASVAQTYDLCYFSQLVNVKIELRVFRPREEDEYDLDLVVGHYLLQRLSSARNLDICPVCVQALLWRTRTLPLDLPFPNLNALRMAVEHLDYASLSLILSFLVTSPHLITLVVEVRDVNVRPSPGGEDHYSEVLGDRYEHGRGVLEKIEIRCTGSERCVVVDREKSATGCDCTETVLELVKVLLGSQARLQRLLLSKRLLCDRGSAAAKGSSLSHVLNAVMEKVLSLPKRSPKLVVAFL